MFARFFVDRPVFATVLSVVIVLIGLVALQRLPVAQYPEVTPPVVSIVATYPGANAQTVADTVASPIEQEVNGVENMLYMSSRSTNDGQMTLDVTFQVGTNLDMAQVLVQNRVQIANAKLPDEVKRQGVTVKKKSPSILLCVNLISDKPEYNQLFLSNFATIQIKDSLARLPGVGDVTFFGPRDYSMRIWLDPNKLATRNMTVGDVMQAVKEQNVQVAAGRLGQPPTPVGQNFQLTINTLGRLSEPAQFLDIVVKTAEGGKVVYLRDVVRDTTLDATGQPVGGVELGAKNYDVSTYLTDVQKGTRTPCITLVLFQLPGSNALSTAAGIKAKMNELRKSPQWKEGIDYRIVYDTTQFVAESIHEVYKTLFEAFILVFIVVLIFLQDWRATLLPMIDVPVSLIGTFAVMAALGFSLNNLSLFGLVLAIGIVVDDAIVVVENVERWMATGLPPREATIKAMDEITGPVIAITLVLASVFIPTAFLAGISGQFFKQFALTIATSTIISAINALTMAPARAVTLIKPHTHGHGETREALPRWGFALLGGAVAYFFLYSPITARLGWAAAHGHDGEAAPHGSPVQVWGLRLGLFALGALAGWLAAPVLNRLMVGFFNLFNKAFTWITAGYGLAVRGVLRVGVVMLLVYAGLIGLTYLGFTRTPKGFIPDQDKGYAIAGIQLPEGASLERTENIVQLVSDKARQVPGIAYLMEVPGYSPFTSSNISNQAAIFVIFEPFEERKHDRSRAGPAIMAKLRQSLATVPGAVAGVFGAPAIDGLGTTGGFKLQLQDKGGAGLPRLQGAAQNVIQRGNQPQSGVVGLFSSFSVAQPQVLVNVDRVKAKSMGVSLTDVFQTLQAYLGSAYINDITAFNRNWQVNLQADARFRLQPEDIGRLEVRNAAGKRVPLSTLITVEDVNGPAIVNHYNLFPSAEVMGAPAPGRSSMQAIDTMNALASDPTLVPDTVGHEWTELSKLEIQASEDLLSKLIFPLAVVFVFMVLAAQYESWSMPLAIILIVPMCLLAAVIGIRVARLDINIFSQIGLVVLVALAAKNAILIVEFAKQRQDEGLSRHDAVVDACKTRLRPIIMTSLAFILGVVPLVTSKGAGAEMRFSLGVAVFSGMLGVTFFGLFFTPVFYDFIRRLAGESKRP